MSDDGKVSKAMNIANEKRRRSTAPRFAWLFGALLCSALHVAWRPQGTAHRGTVRGGFHAWRLPSRLTGSTASGEPRHRPVCGRLRSNLASSTALKDEGSSEKTDDFKGKHYETDFKGKHFETAFGNKAYASTSYREQKNKAKGHELQGQALKEKNARKAVHSDL